MELGFPLWRDGMLIATDGVPPCMQTNPVELGFPLWRLRRGFPLWRLRRGLFRYGQKGCGVETVGLRCCGTCAALGSWHAIDGLLSRCKSPAARGTDCCAVAGLAVHVCI
jgi:hypothetical protein